MLKISKINIAFKWQFIYNTIYNIYINLTLIFDYIHNPPIFNWEIFINYAHIQLIIVYIRISVSFITVNIGWDIYNLYDVYNIYYWIFKNSVGPNIKSFCLGFMAEFCIDYDYTYINNCCCEKKKHDDDNIMQSTISYSSNSFECWL